MSGYLPSKRELVGLAESRKYKSLAKRVKELNYVNAMKDAINRRLTTFEKDGFHFDLLFMIALYMEIETLFNACCKLVVFQIIVL